MKTLLGCVTALAMAAPLIPAPPAAAQQGPPRFYDLRKAPKPKVTGKEIIAGLEEYVDKFPLRQNGFPNNRPAAEFLAKDVKKYGFRSKILEIEVSDRTCLVVESIRKGTTKPKEWIAFVAHYDIVAGGGFTIQGAYDDGSGTNMLRYFGKEFGRVETKHSIALLWFDCEENGLLASDVYAERVKKRGQKISAALGFDMVGIGYPARYCICLYHGPAPKDARKAVPIFRYVNYEFLKFPEGDGGAGASQRWPIGGEGHVCICGINIRNSDEQNFAQQGYFTMRWTGMRTALDYPGYHMPWDTVPLMEVVAEGRANLEEGTENTFVSAYYTAIVIDNL